MFDPSIPIPFMSQLVLVCVVSTLVAAVAFGWADNRRRFGKFYLIALLIPVALRLVTGMIDPRLGFQKIGDWVLAYGFLALASFFSVRFYSLAPVRSGP